MSRSRRSTPVTGITTSDSEKQDKRHYNRRFRRACKQVLDSDAVNKPIPLLREVGDPWTMGKDGKTRFDPVVHAKLMRK